MMDNMSLGDFSPKVMAAILYAVVTLLAFSVFSMLAGAGNTMHLNTQQACVVSGVRFDRVLLISTNTNYDTADEGQWENGVNVTQDGTGCHFAVTATTEDSAGVVATAATALAATVSNGFVLTPTGERIAIATPTLSSSAGSVDISNSTWAPVESMFQDNTTLLNVVIGALALLIGVSPMSVLGMVGYYILQKFDTGQSTIASIIMVVLGAIIAVSLLSTFVSFISNAYDAIDADRFTVFRGGLANLAVVIKQFWGVVLIVSFFGLGAMLFKSWRDSKNGTTADNMADSRVLS